MPFFGKRRRKYEADPDTFASAGPGLHQPYLQQAPPAYYTHPMPTHNTRPSLPNMTSSPIPTTNYQPYLPLTRTSTAPPRPIPPRPQDPRRTLHQEIGDKLGDVLTLMDEDAFTGSDAALQAMFPDVQNPESANFHLADRSSGAVSGRSGKGQANHRGKGDQRTVFSKVDLYINSRLPASLPPLRVYIPTYPLLCLAAQYSSSAYATPQSRSERKDFVSADGRLGTKAMVIKSVPCDDKKTIVFAIRGTSMMSIRDWGVNLQTDAVSPRGFLDDEGNLCHSGFLKVAKAMVKPIAARLRTLLEEDPNRTSCSLLITGHSAGGAVASLLYTHMLSELVQSELSILTGCFRRVHCVVFGAPPISLLSLQKPRTVDGRLQKCIFFSFMNEGDPVVRAERAYIKSLVDLLSQPLPAKIPSNHPSSSAWNLLNASMSRLDLQLKPSKRPQMKPHTTQLQARTLWWDVPPSYLSNAGRLIVLRVPDGGQEADVTASTVKDEQLRQVMFGDPLVHAMDVYARRINCLAVRAVTGGVV
ncbi:hypothetical protein PV10_07503 [Exophiala mesophila]|uniref:Fungal lipase-type domain-containing protein n=1 Tax=Exophiala mesophila TaxID=212818 RepID=A0A0D1Z5R6_EXOME|nr:uncharacterized protein PV10_07503 [Exophiala mesophila]KIV90172.1 hypothetical protein PV10_07503 [Exophiala mesophila]